MLGLSSPMKMPKIKLSFKLILMRNIPLIDKPDGVVCG